ncbi:hypothetical protein QQS21_011602 [Conoideocrella luteorostrata]|uniref:Calcineurin-like phosphoesterase domain-containing protein n=1 Tax=Conoideocrella luteorostrata TaxID=1105319 RepID=A0AAJ0CCT3_9HYPO|nr:hypothetical protein QQS21_011602 [Conoideocrella luteorostrata]
MHNDAEEQSRIKTRFIILSDTHGEPLAASLHNKEADVAIHCGNLTQHSTIKELHTTLQLLRAITAPIKLVIAGNHDFTLDDVAFENKLLEGDGMAGETLDRSLVKQRFGDFGEARNLLLQAKDEGIFFLGEGTHSLSLENGALLQLYASPYTPGQSGRGNWGFQYQDREDHVFNIEQGTDVVISHGPPHGVLDRTMERQRLGCPDLFAAVARQQPLLHCFGHVHRGWGAKMVSWRPEISKKPSHFTDIDNEKSVVIGSLFLSQNSDPHLHDPNDAMSKREEYRSTSHCEGEEIVLGNGKTLFINASIKGDGDGNNRVPWVVDILLPKSALNEKRIQ